MDLYTYNKALKEYRKWLYYNRPMDYLAVNFLSLQNQWDWFGLFDKIASGG